MGSKSIRSDEFSSWSGKAANVVRTTGTSSSGTGTGLKFKDGFKLLSYCGKAETNHGWVVNTKSVFTIYKSPIS